MVKIKPHFQSLALGYLTYRMKAYSKILYKLGMPVVKKMGLENKLVPYWIGQTLVVAKKGNR